MRSFLFVVLTSLLFSFSLAQPLPLTSGACVMGVTKVEHGKLVFEHPVKVYKNAIDHEPFEIMSQYDTYYVASTVGEGKRVRLVIAPGIDSNPNAGRIYGWVDKSDIQVLNDINCI